MKKLICCLLLISIMLASLVSCNAIAESKDKKILKNVASLISEGSYTEALSALETLKDPQKGESLKEDIFDKMENEIVSLMEDGDYIKAQKKLDKYTALPNYVELSNSIKYETLALYALMNLRPRLKNPNSLQATEVLFFESTENAAYPGIITTTSGQNGFGGYSTNYTLFQAQDMSVAGSCSSLDADKLSDYSDKLICLLITSLLTGGHKINQKVDINRINLVLSSGKTPKLDIEQYKMPGGFKA